MSYSIENVALKEYIINNLISDNYKTYYNLDDPLLNYIRILSNLDIYCDYEPKCNIDLGIYQKIYDNLNMLLSLAKEKLKMLDIVKEDNINNLLVYLEREINHTTNDSLRKSLIDKKYGLIFSNYNISVYFEKNNFIIADRFIDRYSLLYLNNNTYNFNSLRNNLAINDVINFIKTLLYITQENNKNFELECMLNCHSIKAILINLDENLIFKIKEQFDNIKSDYNNLDAEKIIMDIFKDIEEEKINQKKLKLKK